MVLEFPNIDPIAFSLGPLPVRWYALAYMAGFLLGWRYALYLCGLDPKKKPHRIDIDDFLPLAILGVILGGRIGYVFFYQWDLYAADPLEILKVWHGGMSFHGGTLGVIAALFGYAFVRDLSVLRLADIICASVPIGLFFGRIANFINGELYGRVADVPWAFVFPRGGPAPRHPSQLYEALLEGALLFSILCFLMHRPALRNHPGIVSGAFLAGYALFRMIIENYREPDDYIGLVWDAISMGQLLSLPMFAAGVGLIVFSLTRAK